MDLEVIMLREVRQKDKYCMISLIWAILKSWTHRNEEKTVVTRGWGVGRNEMLAKGYTLSVIRWISCSDIMYSMMIIVTNTVLHILETCLESDSLVFSTHAHPHTTM